jgi:hypothetical protein
VLSTLRAPAGHGLCSAEPPRRRGRLPADPTDLRIPPTSNQAERDLRPSKVQEKISGRLTSEERTKDRYLIRGTLSTATKHLINPLTALRDAFTGTTWLPPAATTLA